MEIDKIKSSCSKYITFCNCLTSTTKKIHNNGSRYVSQGCCQFKSNTFVTCYDSGHVSNKLFNKQDTINNSILEIINSVGKEKTLILDHNYHVGGISYSKKNNKIYIVRNPKNNQKDASINYYDINTIINLPDNTYLNNYGTINLPECNYVSYLTIDNDYLFVGDFHNNKIVKYKLLKNGTSTKYEKTYNIKIKKIQGMCIFKYKNKEYYAFSSSYGRATSSKLIIAILENDNFNIIKEIKLPCMSEQVSLDSNGNLMIIFENDSMKYQSRMIKPTKNINHICHLSIEKIMN